MGNFTKNQQRRELMKANVERAKQSTLDDMSFQFNVAREKDAIKPSKAIIIDRISDTTKEDELELKIEFSLLPSKTSFSKVNLDLYFQETLLKSAALIIPQSQLINDNFEYLQVLEMKGIAAGEYLVRVEMYEPWSSGERLNFTAKEITVHYVPQTKSGKICENTDCEKRCRSRLNSNYIEGKRHLSRNRTRPQKGSNKLKRKMVEI